MPPSLFSGNGTVTGEDSSIADMDYFLKTLSEIHANGVRPDLIGSVITHYASKWLPDLCASGHHSCDDSPETSTAMWMRKRLCVETLVGVLPSERDSVPCNFLLRLLHVANMVDADPSCRVKLERRVMWQLDQASPEELMIPSFSHTCRTLLDVALMLRLVKGFVDLHDFVRSRAAFVKVAKVVDDYLAEAAIDLNFSFSEFVNLAGALPAHARLIDDGLYRAVDTYLKAHPGVSKQERKTMCRLIDSRKLSHEASFHAIQNERLPVRVVIQILFSEQVKLHRHVNWSGSFSGTKSPGYLDSDHTVRCQSKREITKQMEIKKLKDDVIRLESQCAMIQGQIETMLKKRGLFKWKKIGIAALRSISGGGDRSDMDNEFRRTKSVKGKIPNKWRRSIS